MIKTLKDTEKGFSMLLEDWNLPAAIIIVKTTTIVPNTIKYMFTKKETPALSENEGRSLVAKGVRD
jgi:hypothetical protein